MDNQYGNDGNGYSGNAGGYDSGSGSYGGNSGGYDGGNGSYGGNSGGYNGGNNYNYNSSPDPDELPMTLGEWLLTIFLSMIPCVGFILMLVWAFGSTGNVNRRNYARAMLIISIIATVLTFLSYGMFAATFYSILKDAAPTAIIMW